MIKHAILQFPDHPTYNIFRNTVHLVEYSYTNHSGCYKYKLTKQLSGISTNSVGITLNFHPDNLGFYSPEGALQEFGSPENVALYNAVLRPTQLSHFHRDSHAI